MAEFKTALKKSHGNEGKATQFPVFGRVILIRYN